LPAFPDHPGFVAAQAESIRPLLPPDSHVLFSYHGLPERQIRKADPTGTHCLSGASCCDALDDGNRHCYRAQCLATTRALARELGLPEGSFSTSFQSRLGRIPWIGPATDETARTLVARGIRHLVVATPSFVTDCLETLEEIGHGLRATFLEAGGTTFSLAPCVNASPTWVRAVAGMARAPLG
jgi:ferrochelatase